MVVHHQMGQWLRYSLVDAFQKNAETLDAADDGVANRSLCRWRCPGRRTKTWSRDECNRDFAGQAPQPAAEAPVVCDPGFHLALLIHTQHQGMLGGFRYRPSRLSGYYQPVE